MMRKPLALIAALGLAVGPAAAQGTFSPGRKPGSAFGSSAQSSTAKPRTYLPQEPAQYVRPRSYGVPQSPNPAGFQPYKPFTGSSVYGRPNGSAYSGAKPCETSVYVNACDRKR